MTESVDFGSIFQSLPGNYIILAPDAPRFTILAYNQARADQTFTRPEHIGQGIFEAFPDNPGDPQANGVRMLTASLDTVMATRQLHQMAIQKYDIPTKDRKGFEERYWLPRNIPVLDKNGGVIYIIHHVQDITALVAAEQREQLTLRNLDEQVAARKELEYAEETARLALESADLGAYEVNIITNEAFTTPRFNAICGLNGTGPRSRFPDSIHPDDQPTRLKALEESVQTGRLFYEVRVIHPDSSQHWVRINGLVLYDDMRKPVRMIGIVQDISKQRSFEEEMTRLVGEKTRELRNVNQRLENSNNELQQFAYITSHDLQEPLRKIQVFISVLLEQKAFNEKTPELLEKITKTAERMRGLISDLLNYSRLSQSDEQLADVDLNQVLISVLSDFELLIADKKAVFEIDPLPVIEAIPFQMTQLFINLLGNALKFTRQGVPVVIKVKAQESGDGYEITISDNGVGFDQQYATKIFTVFQRLSDQKEYSGHGIGLAICKKVVANHLGTIRAKGVLNEGASFTFTLPRRPQREIIPAKEK